MGKEKHPDCIQVQDGDSFRNIPWDNATDAQKAAWQTKQQTKKSKSKPDKGNGKGPGGGTGASRRGRR